MRRIATILALFGVLAVSNFDAVGLPVDHGNQYKGGGGGNGGGGYGGHYYNSGMTAHVAVGNPAWIGEKPTASALQAQATQLITYANNLKQQGLLAQAQTTLLNNLKLFATANDSTVAYQEAQAFGNQISIAWMNSDLASIGPSERQQIATTVQQQGLYNVIVALANYLNQLSQEVGQLPSSPKYRNAGKHRNENAGKLLHTSYDGGRLLRVNRAKVYTDTMAMVGAVLVCLPGLELLGGFILIGAAAGTLAGDLIEE